METKQYTLHVRGMHCKSCAVLIEHTLSEVPFIKKVHADSNAHSVSIEAETNLTSEALVLELTPLISKDGYMLSIEKQKHKTKWIDFMYAVPIALVLIFGFVLLQKLGLVNLITADKVSYPVAFGIGLIASISSCLAVVGGLLLSVSANYVKQGGKIKPQALFHVGRLISFFVFGGIIGAIGSAFTLSATATFILSILVGLVMLVLGLNLLEVFPWAKRLQFHMPKKLAVGAHTMKNMEFGLAPFLVGVSTFFLPCGFTQSMQIYSLSTGSFVTGALTMTFFALGTLPVLSLISFTSVRFGKGKFASIFFKSAGILVIVFGIFTVLNGLVAKGIITPFYNF
ncbi:MAG: sulfite exporter TauE/SafE family protein [bacterium]